MSSLAQAATPAKSRKIADLPGPRRMPLLGNALQLDRDRMHLQLEAWAREHGEAYSFSILSRRFLVLSNPQAVAGVLRDRPDGFRRTTRLEEISREMGFLGLFSAAGETWRRQRPMVLAGLDPTHIKAFFPTLIQVTERFAGRWRKAAQGGEAIDLRADLMRYTVDVTAALAFGEDINTIEAEEEQVIQSHLRPGRYLALAEIKMVLAMLLANFEITSVATDDGREPEERISLTMFPLGLSMRLKAAPPGSTSPEDMDPGSSPTAVRNKCDRGT
jgi:cytochrome P450